MPQNLENLLTGGGFLLLGALVTAVFNYFKGRSDNRQTGKANTLAEFVALMEAQAARIEVVETRLGEVEDALSESQKANRELEVLHLKKDLYIERLEAIAPPPLPVKGW